MCNIEAKGKDHFPASFCASVLGGSFRTECVVAPRTNVGGGGDHKGGGGREAHWSHLEQRLGDQEVMREIGTHWSHLEQREDDE